MFLLLFASSSFAGAQAVDLSAFQDSLQQISDVEQLRLMFAQRSGRNARSAAALTERGFVALRLWDLTTQRVHSKNATQSFRDALKRDPDYGWAHYGLGLAYVSGPDAHPEKAGWRGAFVLDDVIAGLLGDDVRSRAHREFQKAVSGTPSVSRAADELAENAVIKNKRKTLEDARNVLALHVGAAPSDGEGWLALARVETELGMLDDAELALSRALEHGISGSESARTRAALLLRMRGHEEEGARAWFSGLEGLTPDGSAEYYGDLEPLLSKREREAWQTKDLAQRAEFLRTFWDLRSALGGVTTTERLAEHYRRLAHARRAFFRNAKYRAPEDNELRMLPFSQRSDYDDRGLIYIRHGAPQANIGRSTFISNAPGASAQMVSYESWAYLGLDGHYRSFHFESGAGNDYHLMHKLPCNPDWLDNRTAMDPRFGLLATRSRICGTTEWLSLSADMRQVAFEALATDSDRPNFTKELPFFFDLYTFRGNEGRTAVVAAVAVPYAKLNYEPTGQYRLDVSLILADTASKRVMRQDDSVRLVIARTYRPDDLFRLHVEVAAPPSRSTVQRVIVSDPTEPGIGQLYGGPFPIPDYSGSKLMLSDLVLAEPVAEGHWHRGAVALALVPTGYFKGGTFNVFYEIYNIAPSAPYSTEIEIEPVRSTPGQKIKGILGGKNKMTLRFDGVASNAREGTLQELRRVEALLPPARYRMRITVRNLETHETARTERTFTVPKP